MKSRSIWETRFYALCEMMRAKKDMLEHKVSRLALGCNLTPQDRENLRNRIEVLDQMISQSEDIEKKSGDTIFLFRDF